MTTLQAILTVFVVGAATALTRFLPFWLFPEGRTPPALVIYLGKVLPFAAIGMLVVYCLKEVTFTAVGGFMPQLLAVILVAVLHLWRHSTLLSIGVGTVFYMILVQCFF